jgi:hypothetical protein
MFEHENESIVQRQARTKPKIEEMITEYLDGEAEQSMLKFLEICKANGIKNPWSATNIWYLKLNKQTIGMIYIGRKPCADVKKGIQKNVWYTCVYSAPNIIHEGLNKAGISEQEKEDITYVIHRNLAKCVNDKKRCAPLKALTILGKEFTESDNLCSSCGGTNYSILFVNPDDRTLYWINKALELEKKTREKE